MAKEKSKKKQNGQTIVEFIFLLAMLFLISFSFLKTFNRNLAKVWTEFARIVVDDSSVSLKL